MKTEQLDLPVYETKSSKCRTTSGRLMLFPAGLEVTTVCDYNRVFHLNLKNWTKNYIKKHKYGI